MKNQALGSLLLLATLSWQLDEVGAQTNTGNGRECVSDDGESSRLRLRSFEDDEGPMIAIDECVAEWINICNSQSTEGNISRICAQLTGVPIPKAESNMGTCVFTTTRIDEILQCLDKECQLECLTQFIVPTKMIPTTSAIPTKPPNNIITTKQPDDNITTNSEPDGVTTVSVTTKESSPVVLGNNIERNLAVIVGGSLAGVILLLVAMIVFILIIAVALYKSKHKSNNITQSSSNKVGASDRDNDSLTERYQVPHDYATPQPADYEVFQPSSVSTVASGAPLLDTMDPQPYEVLDGYMRQGTGDGHDYNRVYETVKNISTQENEHSNSAGGHIYFTLEPRDDIRVSSEL